MALASARISHENELVSTKMGPVPEDEGNPGGSTPHNDLNDNMLYNRKMSTTQASQITSSQEFEEPALNIPTDRYIPLLSGTCQNKIDPTTLKQEVPPPSASPISHLKAQTKMVFKQNVAEACGLDMKERILQYMPQPPTASFKRQSFSFRKKNHYNYNDNAHSETTGILSNEPVMKLRKINTNPEKILDAPRFVDNFYLNLLSWSSKNTLAIALENELYLWNANTGDATRLTEYKEDLITSVTWSDDDCHISVGKDNGDAEIWDVEAMSLVRTMRSGLGVRCGSQSWLNTLLATGYRSGEIQINDVRIKQHIVSNWNEHTEEVCGLAYRNDGLQLASGGNDNTVMIWDTRTSQPQWIKRAHTAAVKALSWCPYMPNVLATGGGQTDKQIFFWNTNTGAKLGSINTGSQVSSLHWGQSYGGIEGPLLREIAATGGAPGNSISVYNYDTKFKVAEILHAHESRICTSQISPDGTTLATVAGDENLKFYKIFDPMRPKLTRSKTDTMDDILNFFEPHSDKKSRHPNGEVNNKVSSSHNSSSLTTSVTPSSSTQNNLYLIR